MFHLTKSQAISKKRIAKVQHNRVQIKHKPIIKNTIKPPESKTQISHTQTNNKVNGRQVNRTADKETSRNLSNCTYKTFITHECPAVTIARLWVYGRGHLQGGGEDILGNAGKSIKGAEEEQGADRDQHYEE
jgi:hypothetical protein